MSAGSGIMHAEFNREDETAQIFQIWIEPAVHGVAPRWETRSFPKAGRQGRLVTLASGRTDDRDALTIYQDAAIFGAPLAAVHAVTPPLAPGRTVSLGPAPRRVTGPGNPPAT